MKKVSIDKLAEAVAEELKNYDQSVTNELKSEIKQVAKECRKEIANASPVLTGDYKKGWKDKKVFEDESDIRMLICNPKEYPLTHLLEYGHVSRNGTGRTFGRVEAIPHIKKAEENAEEKLGKKVKVIIKG